MCQECGCSKPGPYQVGERLVDAHSHSHSHTHTLPDGSVVTHSHDDGHGHSHGHVHPHQILNLNTGILSANDRAAEQNRGAFKALNLLALNVVSSPGAGKTTLLTKTITELKGRLRCGVIVGDLATDNDAARQEKKMGLEFCNAGYYHQGMVHYTKALEMLGAKN